MPILEDFDFGNDFDLDQLCLADYLPVDDFVMRASRYYEDSRREEGYEELYF